MINVGDNIGKVLSYVERLSSQYQFAVASALTFTARDARDELPRQADRDLDKPTPFTKQGFYFRGAQKNNLVAVVGVKPLQARYLRFQIEGGRRRPQRKALRLPGDVELNTYGNLPAGLIRQLVQRAKAGRRATKTQAARFGVSQELDLFYGDPGDGRPPGIYKRVVLSATRHQLIPVVVFPEQPADYERRFDARGAVANTARRVFPQHLRRAFDRARATAR